MYTTNQSSSSSHLFLTHMWGELPISLMVHPTMKKIANCFIYTPHERETHTSNRFQSKFIKILFLLSLSLISFACKLNSLACMMKFLFIFRDTRVDHHRIHKYCQQEEETSCQLYWFMTTAVRFFWFIFLNFFFDNEKLECHKIKKTKLKKIYRNYARFLNFWIILEDFSTIY